VPDWAHAASEAQLADWMLGELQGEIEASGVPVRMEIETPIAMRHYFASKGEAIRRSNDDARFPPDRS
jgi:hypothetical protein